MIHPVVRVLVERAAAGRVALLDLAGVVPGEYWQRRAPGGAWTAQEHLTHALTADGLLLDVLAEPGQAVELARVRAEAIGAGVKLPYERLLEAAAAQRQELIRFLEGLPANDLEGPLVFPGTSETWGRPRSISVQRYLEVWAAHDAEHTAAIREAISAAPDLSAVARTQRLL